MKTDTEVKCEGIQALIASLGEVNAERFVALISREPFDYTRGQRGLWKDKDVMEISSKAMAWQTEIEEGIYLRTQTEKVGDIHWNIGL